MPEGALGGAWACVPGVGEGFNELNLLCLDTGQTGQCTTEQIKCILAHSVPGVKCSLVALPVWLKMKWLEAIWLKMIGWYVCFHHDDW